VNSPGEPCRGAAVRSTLVSIAGVAAVLASFVLPVFLSAQNVHDVVLRGGRVVDPESGLDAVRNVAITGGTIRALSTEPLRGKTEIDATGLLVSPGFVDLHSHGTDAGRLPLQGDGRSDHGTRAQGRGLTASPTKTVTPDIRKARIVTPRRLFAAAVLVSVVGATALAQSKDPQVGTWKLNAEKSKNSPFKSGTVKVEPAGEAPSGWSSSSPAPTSATCPFNSTPLSWAQHNKQDGVFEWMRAHCAIDLHDAVCFDLREQIEARLQEDPASINKRLDQWEFLQCTPLHWAAGTD
jgi:hypothetical protein